MKQQISKHPDGAWNKLVHVFVAITGYLPALIFFRPKVYYQNKNVQGKKLEPGTLLVSNHESLMDFVLYLLVFVRSVVHFLVAEVLFNKNVILEKLLLGLGCIRVERQSYDFSFIHTAAEVLKNGGKVAIFPEGRLPVKGQHFPYTPSWIMIALESGCKVVPICTNGQYGFGKRSRCMIGEPFSVSDYCHGSNPPKEELTACNEAMKARILEMKGQLEALKE